jgi:hypothetical protein
LILRKTFMCQCTSKVVQAKTGINTKVIIFASLIVVVLAGLALGGFLFPRTVVIEPTQVLSTVERITTTHQVIGNHKTTNVLGGSYPTGWGYSLGTRKAGDKVVVDLSSVHEVYVCFAKLNKTLPDIKYITNNPPTDKWLEPTIYYYRASLWAELPIGFGDCEERTLTKSGVISFTIPSQGNYTLVIGKAAGYIATSFKIDVTIIETKEVIVTETITITTMTTRTL